MIPLFQNDNILNIDIIAIQEPWRNTRDITIYHPRKNAFHLLYPETNKARVCYFINKKIDQSTWTYTIDGPDVMSLHLSLPDRCIHIHNIYNPVNSEEVSTSIPILKRKLAAHPNEEHIVLGDFNLHHEVWGGPRASKALIEKSEELLMVTQRWEMEQMVPVGTATYKESTGESTINLIFATPLLSESIISCDIAEDFDYDSDHQPILSKWTMRTIDNPPIPRFLLSKIDIPLIKKKLKKELAKNPLSLCTTVEELNVQVDSLINTINTTINLAIPKAKVSPKLVPGFDEKCKKVQMKARRLKKIWKKEEIEES